MAFFGSVPAYNMYPGLSDEDVLVRVRLGDTHAAEALFIRYRSLIEKQARTYFVVGADHEDVVQEGMMGLWKAIRDFNSDRLPRFAPFAELCVTRQIITAVKAATRQKHSPLNSYVSLNRNCDDEVSGNLLDYVADPRGVNPEELALKPKVPKNMPEQLNEQLTPLEMLVVRLYLDSKSYGEIATELICGRKTVDNALQRAKRKIKRMLDD
ncbi:MAG: RNA polymerase sporulation sigma factor SigH [Armatimonadota bacterium]|nr:RNA polymerase sporulation sigma factor SigH [Armatimonadota bacterium]